MLYSDLHTHTRLCNHATGEPGDYLKQAVSKGLTWYGISDHFPAPAGYDPEFRMMPLEYAEYRKIVAGVQQEARESGSDIQVLYAAEFDYVPGRMAEVYTALDREDFDYLIGSIHYVDDFAFDDPSKKEEWFSRGVDYIWGRYAELLCEFVTGYRFEIMGHADLPKKFSLFPTDEKRFLMQMQSIFELAAKKEICMELNTAGLRKDVREIYPSLSLLKLAREAGVRITFGSDAHAPEEIGAGLADALILAQEAGYRSHVVFQKRQAIEIAF